MKLIRILFCLGLSTIALVGCNKVLDTATLETNIQQTIIKDGGISLKSVVCPKSVQLEAGKGFDCVGELDSGDTVAIPVNQIDGEGTTSWEVPNAKGLLNLPKLESIFQQALKQEGKTLTIDCGEGYRSVRPGDRFECKVGKPETQSTKAQKPAGKKASVPNVPETIAVTIDSEGNVSWQQVIPTSPAEIARAKASSSAGSNPVANSSTTDASPQTPASGTSEDRDSWGDFE